MQEENEQKMTSSSPMQIEETQRESSNRQRSPSISHSHSSKSISHSHSSHSHSSSYEIINESHSNSNEEKNQRKERGVSPLVKATTSKYVQLDFMLFFSKTIQTYLENKTMLSKIENKIGDVKMLFDPSFIIPDYNGCLLKIKGSSIKKKRDAAQSLLEFILQNNIDQPESESKNIDNIKIIIIIPNGLVSMVIGTRGKQISNLIKESKASIVVNQPIYKMTFRTVSISGKPSNVADAIMSIQRIMEDRYNEVTAIEFECKPLNVNRTQTNVKLIFDIDIIERIRGKHHSLLDDLQEEFNISTKVYQDKKNRQLDRKDYICSLKGTIVQVQKAIIKITRKIKNEIRVVLEGKESYTLKMLINKVFVTKLIGAGGCMIQGIANFSKGASINIMSNKHDEKKSSCHDIPVCITGKFSSVQDACCIIIEQMECFKNGGPVLRSGRNLHQNIASQFINSIFTSASHEDSEDEHIYTIRERFQLNKESPHSDQQSQEINLHHSFSERSRAKSNSRHHHKSKVHSHSKSSSGAKSRSRSRNKSRSRSRHHREEGERYRKREREREREVSKRGQFDKNISSFSYEEEGEMKIHTDFVIPDHLVNLLIGKNGENIRGLMSKSGAKISFSQEYNDDNKLNTTNGVGRLCNLRGTPKQNAIAMQMILDLVIKFENIFEGVGKEK